MNQRPALSRRLLAALVAAVGGALVTYAVTVLAYYIGLQGQSATAGAILGLFLGPALFLLVFMFVAGAIEAFTTRVRVVVFSIIAGVFAVYLGILVRDSLEGGSTFQVYSSDAQAAIYSSGLAFIIIGVVVSFTVGRRLYSRLLSADTSPAETGVARTALVRQPAITLSKGQLTHLKRKVVRLPKAQEQWAAYVEALRSEGFRIVEIEKSDTHPDSVFIEDTVVMLGQVAVIGSPGAETRRGEPDAVAAKLKELGFETHSIRLPGTLDGGDVLKIDDTIYVGRGGRTNAEGIRQFRAIAGELGYTVVAVPVTKALHLKSSVTALPDGTVIGHPDLVDNPAIFPSYLEVPEVEGVAVLVLSPSAVLMSSAAPKSVALIEDLGYRVVTVDIGEFEKLEGCVTCLSVRIR
ncbi:MAG TPA: arginine deiminase-related protein [Galbitalea sp.]|jgi:dimethylargininase